MKTLLPLTTQSSVPLDKIQFYGLVTPKNSKPRFLSSRFVLPFLIALVGFLSFTDKASATTNVYYSVGQSSSNLGVGSSVSITSGAAVFTAAQTGNIGVGDRVTYDSDNKVAFISAKTNADQMHWTLITATGGTPTDVSGVTVTSIKHEYTTLSAAVAGAKDASHINNTDLTAADVVLNIPCYYDSGADTTAVTVSGYTTDAARYIKVYTPNNTSTEANNNQRHQGKWDDSKWRIMTTAEASVISVRLSYTIIDGLQVAASTGSYGAVSGIYVGSTDHATRIIIKNNIVKNGYASGTGRAGINITNTLTHPNFVYNNIVYDFSGTNTAGISGAIDYGASPSFVYNNTVYNCYYGIKTNTNRFKAVNNIVQNTAVGGDGYIGSFYSGSDYNISDLSGDSTGGAHDKVSTTVSFADSANKDFHLAPTDTGAKNAGTNLSSDSNLPFSDDIDGQTRPDPWDIGADESHFVDVAVGGSADGSAPPVAHWKFDEGYGGTAHNEGIGGTALNGTLGTGSSAPTWSNDGKYGKALSFDGSNDYVEVADAPAFTLSSGYTLSAWIKVDAFTGKSRYIIDQWGAAGTGNAAWIFYLTSGGLLAIGTHNGTEMVGSTLATDSALSTGVWYFVTGVYTGSFYGTNGFIYVNGQLVKSGTLNQIPQDSSNYPVRIGESSSGSDTFFDGLIDEPKIWNYALTADQVKREYNGGMAMQVGSAGSISGTGLPTRAASGEYCVPGDTTSCAAPVGEWKMDEKVSGDAKTIYDTSGSGNNGTTNDGANNTGMNCSVPGKFGTGCQFDGVDDYASAVNASSLSITNGTVSLWMKATAFTGYDTLVSKMDFNSTRNGYGLHTRNISGDVHVNYVLASASAGQQLVGANYLLPNTWYHVVMTWDGSFIKGYVNGNVDLVSTAQTLVPITNVYNLLIGKDNTQGSTNVNGSLDQVRIYNYARTPAQIAWEYNKGKPVAEYRFNECTGSTVHDESANRNDGTISLGASGQTATGSCSASANTPWYNGRTGKYAASLNFDGTDDYVSIGSTIPVVNAVSLWIKPGSTTQSIIDLDGGTHKISISSGAVTATGFTSYYVDGNLNGTVSDTNWHHIIAIANTAFTTTSSLRIGKISSAYFSGQLDDVKIFNYALTATQVKTLYNAASAVQF